MSFRPKLIALDCDGTLLDSKSRLTERTKRTLQEAIRQGIYVVIATGRMYPSALPLINEIGTTAPCVFYNGALVRSPLTGETYYQRGLGRGLTAELVDFYLGHGWYIQTYCDDKLYVYDDSDECCKMYEGIAGIKAVPLGADFSSFSREMDASKVLGISRDHDVFMEMLSATKEKFAGRLYVASSWDAFVEMVHPEVNKARGVEKAAEAVGVAREDVMTFGDGSNDKEMLAWAGCGVAMANGSELAKAAADVIAPANDEDGAAQVIERYLN